MTSNELFRSMSDDQLAQWHQLTQRVEQLGRDLAEQKGQRAADNDRHAEEVRSLRTELNTRADVIQQLTMSESHQKQAVRRAAAGLVLALKALEALRDLIQEGKVSAKSSEWPGEVFRAVQDADEVIRAYGIPF